VSRRQRLSTSYAATPWPSAYPPRTDNRADKRARVAASPCAFLGSVTGGELSSDLCTHHHMYDFVRLCVHGVQRHVGTSEIPGFIGKESGIEGNSTQMKELYGNWSLTTSQSLAGIQKMGGFTWSGFNCMLDTDNGYACPPSDLCQASSSSRALDLSRVGC